MCVYYMYTAAKVLKRYLLWLYLQIYPSTLRIAYLRFYRVFRMSVDVDE